MAGGADRRGEHQRKKYTEKSMLTLAARGAQGVPRIHADPRNARGGQPYLPQALYGPLLDVVMLDTRSYRGPNAENMEQSYGPSAYFFAPAQVEWLKRQLKASQAEWKVIACDMPLA